MVPNKVEHMMRPSTNAAIVFSRPSGSTKLWCSAFTTLDIICVRITASNSAEGRNEGRPDDGLEMPGGDLFQVSLDRTNLKEFHSVHGLLVGVRYRLSQASGTFRIAMFIVRPSSDSIAD
jgi:hypothetical protein